MSINLNTRKSIDKITIEDLEQFPIWEFALDDEEQDETYIRPINSRVVPLNNYSMSIYTFFTTASNMEIKGIIEVSTDDGIELGHGALIFNHNYIFIPNNNFNQSTEEYQEIANLMGFSYDKVFPLKFKLAVPIEGNNNIIEGTFPR
jgi:hypothetical protein